MGVKVLLYNPDCSMTWNLPGFIPVSWPYPAYVFIFLRDKISWHRFSSVMVTASIFPRIRALKWFFFTSCYSLPDSIFKISPSPATLNLLTSLNYHLKHMLRVPTQCNNGHWGNLENPKDIKNLYSTKVENPKEMQNFSNTYHLDP